MQTLSALIRPRFTMAFLLLLTVPMATAVTWAQDSEPASEQAGAVSAQADLPDARELLRRFSLAAANQSYTGVLTYEFGAHLASLAVEQEVNAEARQERLLHLNGEIRGVSRQSPLCQSPAEQLLQGGIATLPLDDYYHVSLIGHERVAGREGYVVQVMPKDQYRYGYVITVDVNDYLALKILLVGPGNRVLERFQFVQINSFGEPAGGDRPACVEPTAESAWQAGWLPRGFRYVGARANNDHQMLMFTDGMAAFSIFIEPISAEAALEGKAQRGATVAFLGRLQQAGEHFRVSAVGEAPVTTLERVALSMQKVRP